MEQIFLPLRVANRVELSVYLSQGHVTQFRLHTRLGLEKDLSQDGLDLRANRAFVIRGKMTEAMIRLRFNRTVYIE